ncbi:SubName: Full=Uncharacterized protein {ECO:0000313/EMBL:CCA74568.1} [Serendipita indica DSM 11827]|nr:SubName: Full=Uncharacterized protein {ECO:0000313/EMBL:CCA74568.1} [Serendipita indica DSM 11827]
MLLLIVLQLLSTLFAIAPVVAQESAGGINLPDGTVPHVYDPGFSKNFADMDVPGTLRRMRVVQQVILFAAFHRPPSAVARVHSASVYGLAAGPHKPLVEKDVVMPDILVAAVVVVILGTRALQESQYQLRSYLSVQSALSVQSSLSVQSVQASLAAQSSLSVLSVQSSLSVQSTLSPQSSPPAVTPTSTTSSMNGGTIAGATATAAPEPQAKNNTGAIVGGVVGGIAAICLLIGFIAVLLYKQRKQSSGTSEVASTYRAQVNSPGIPGSPGSVPSGYGYPNTSAPIPALVYNQNELYPNHLHEKNT